MGGRYSDSVTEMAVKRKKNDIRRSGIFIPMSLAEVMADMKAKRA